MNENQLTIVREYELDKPLIQKIDFIIDTLLIEIVTVNMIIHLNINVNMMLNLQISLIMKSSIKQFLIKAWICFN